MIGVHTGDCLGATYEFDPKDRVRRETSSDPDQWRVVGMGPFGWRPGQPTDDTAMTIAVAMGHLDDPARPVPAVWRRFLDWYDGELMGDGERPRDIGSTTIQGLMGRPTPTSRGNGGMMRAIPTALIRDPDQRRNWTADIARLTHTNPLGVAATVAYNDIAAALIGGATVDEAIEEGIATADRLGYEQLGDRIYYAREWHASEQKLASMMQGARGDLLDSLTLAVAALASGRPFDQALVWVIRWGHDTDTNGAIAGGLLGARYGLAAIPARWVRRLEWADWLIGAADRLAVS